MSLFVVRAAVGGYTTLSGRATAPLWPHLCDNSLMAVQFSKQGYASTMFCVGKYGALEAR